jgi:hypothetical protein
VRIIKQTEDPGEGLHQLDEFQELVARIKEAVPGIVIPKLYSIVPTRIEGRVWNRPTDLRRSSTVMERLAQFEAVYEMKPLLFGPVIVVNDNKNTEWEIKDLQTDLEGAVAKMYASYTQEVLAHIWMPRESLPCVPDLLARILADQQKLSQKEEPSDLEIECNAVRTFARSETNRNVRMALLEGLESDDETEIRGIKLCQIWKYLNNPNSEEFTDRVINID